MIKRVVGSLSYSLLNFLSYPHGKSYYSKERAQRRNCYTIQNTALLIPSLEDAAVATKQPRSLDQAASSLWR